MPAKPALKRALGFRDLTLFYVVSGLSVRWVATAAAAGPSTLVVWIIALLAFFVPLAASVLQLSSEFPQEGGLYVWTQEAFGDFSGFIAAWAYWMSNLPYFPAVLYFGAASVLFAFPSHSHTLSSSALYYATFAVVWLAIITTLNVIGVNAGKWLNNIGSIGSIVPLAILFVLAAISASRFGSVTHFSRSNIVPHITLQNAIFYSTIFFAFGGIEAGSFMGEEIKNPRRTIPRALFLGGAILAVGYIAGTVAMLIALPGEAVGGPDGFVLGLQALCSRLGLGWLLVPLALLVGLNAVAGAAAFLSSTSRLPFVAGIDNYLPPAFGSIHPRFLTPWIAIIGYGAAGMVVALLSQAGTTVRGAYNVLVSMSIVAYFLPYLLLFAATLKLQSRPAVRNAFRIPGGRYTSSVLALIGFVSTALTIVLSIVPPEDEPHKALAISKVLVLTLALIGAGVAVFISARHKRRTVLEKT
jgi:glutamate:GABA antiporter